MFDLANVTRFTTVNSNFIAGEWLSGSGPELVTVDPATGRQSWSSKASTADDVSRAAQAARDAFPTWALLPLDERIAAFVAGRSKMLEAIAPVRRAAVLSEPFSRELRARLQYARDTTRHEVERVFAAELALGSIGERRERLAALAAATEWPMWESLRAHQGLSVAQASRVMRRTIVALLH